MADLFLRAFIAHIVSDVLLQPDILSKKKEKREKWIIFHMIVTFASFLFFGWGVLSLKWVLFSLLASISHYIIDRIRIKKGKKGIFIGILDQSSHFACIALFLFILYGKL